MAITSPSTNATDGNSGPDFDLDRFHDSNADTTQAPVLLGIGGGLVFISVALLCARLWSRRRSVSRLSLDDWTVLGATILAIVQYGLLSAAAVYGLGRYARFVSPVRRRVSLKVLFISQVFWYWSITLSKLSVASLLLRFKHEHRWRIFLYSIMTLLLAAAVMQTCFQFLQCRPFPVYWEEQEPVRCFSKSVINGNIVGFSSIQVALDLIFSFVPITFIRKLNRPRREKVFMCILMGLGLFASFAAIVRTLTLQGFYTSRDLFRTNVSIALWAVVEQQFALIAATIPTLKAFAERALVDIGLFFYDEGTETQVRDRLVQFGLLGEGEQLEKPEKSGRKSGSVGTPRKLRDEFGDTVVDTTNDKEVEVMLVMLAKSPV